MCVSEDGFCSDVIMSLWCSLIMCNARTDLKLLYTHSLDIQIKVECDIFSCGFTLEGIFFFNFITRSDPLNWWKNLVLGSDGWQKYNNNDYTPWLLTTCACFGPYKTYCLISSSKLVWLVIKNNMRAIMIKCNVLIRFTGQWQHPSAVNRWT